MAIVVMKGRQFCDQDQADNDYGRIRLKGKARK